LEFGERWYPKTAEDRYGHTCPETPVSISPDQGKRDVNQWLDMKGKKMLT
jgi:hypothetical protein